MTVAAVDSKEPTDFRLNPALAILIAFLTLALAAFLFSGSVPRWMTELPSAYRWGLDKWISDFMKWLVEQASFGLFTFKELTRAIADVLNVPLEIATSILSTGLQQGRGSAAI